MRTLLFAVALAAASLTASCGVAAKSKNEGETQAGRLVAEHRTEAALIYSWLKHTPELNIHRMRGARQNVVYILPPGHKEAVYDAAGKLVQDGVNDGSYNYYPYDQPLNHFMYDILPWTAWGSGKADPTTPKERLVAYVEDLGVGLSAMRKAPAETVNLDNLKPHELVALAVFIGAIEEGGAQEIYAYLANPDLALPLAKGPVIAARLEQGLTIRLTDYRELMSVIPPLPDSPGETVREHR